LGRKSRENVRAPNYFENRAAALRRGDVSVARRRIFGGGAEGGIMAHARGRALRGAGSTSPERFGGTIAMIQTYPLTTIVVVLSLFVYIWVAMKVGSARAKHNVRAPSVEGPEEFQRVFRVHMNTLEQLVIFLPAVALFAAAWGDLAAAVVGIFWPVGRVVYALSYYQEAGRRGPGFGISFLSSMVLLLGALAGAAAVLTARI
jgi:glutathione S-transferase